MYLAAIHFVPINGNLACRNTQQRADEQEFDVERPSVEMHLREERGGSGPREELTPQRSQRVRDTCRRHELFAPYLEATLSIPNAADAERSNENMESVHEQVAESRALGKGGKAVSAGLPGQ